MRTLKKLTIALSIFALATEPAALGAAEAGTLKTETPSPAGFNAKSVKNRHAAQTQQIAAKNTPVFLSATPTPPVDTSAKTHAWLAELQAATTTGLVASHPDDQSFIYHEGIVAEWAKVYNFTQAFTYDQAITGITMLDARNLAGAKKIFDFFYKEWQKEGSDFKGFYTVYNIDTANQWKKYEWRKGSGESAWMGLFALRYSQKAATVEEKTKGAALAVSIGKWLKTLPHSDGAVAMGANDPAGKPNRGALYSTENNLDYYALLRNLSESTLVNAEDKAIFASEQAALKNWLKNKAFDSQAGIFRTGGKVNPSTGQFEWDATKSLDVNSWAVSSIGVSALFFDFEIDVEKLLDNTGNLFAVQDDNSFGGNIRTAKGFDFSDAENARKIGRAGMNWVEGTNQMVLAYKMLGDYYQKAGYDKAGYYIDLAYYFQSRNSDNRVTTQSGNTAYRYADQEKAQIFFNTPSWKTFTGKGVPSSAWVYFAERYVNPFFTSGKSNESYNFVYGGRITYAADGKPTTIVYRDARGRITKTVTFKYNARGNLIREQTQSTFYGINVTNNNHETTDRRYTYRSGRLISEKFLVTSGSSSYPAQTIHNTTKKYSYDSSGKLLGYSGTLTQTDTLNRSTLSYKLYGLYEYKTPSSSWILYESETYAGATIPGKESATVVVDLGGGKRLETVYKRNSYLQVPGTTVMSRARAGTESDVLIVYQTSSNAFSVKPVVRIPLRMTVASFGYPRLKMLYRY